MSPVRSWVVCACAIAVWPVALAAQPQGPPVIVSQGTVVEGNGVYLTFPVTNKNSVAVTAWGINAVFVLPDGRVSPSSYSLDGYMHFALGTTSPEGAVVPPGSTADARILIGRLDGRDQAIRVDVELVFVVFADGTSFGEEREISNIFASRAGERRVWLQIQRAYEMGRKLTSGRAAILAIQDELGTAEDGTARAFLLQMPRRNLSLLLTRAREGRIQDGDVDVALAGQLEYAAARARAAAAHSVRK